MFKRVSKIIKICAYIFFVLYTVKEGYYIVMNTSYLNTGQLMGVEFMIMMIWQIFFSFLISLVIYGFGEIIEYYEDEKTIEK